ncbi:MAG TPA: nucleotidyl transferase AbiEii/AbiGii toxin family protein [Myxococcota bacterium]|nr:nucleotidyl transferase AbiEii/AbiGii toxin family protein [Myxococcota bacterium]
MESRPYATAASFKQALEYRLRQTTTGGAALTRYRQSLVFQRFLARVFSFFGDAAVLKGGVTMEIRISNARSTRDIDLQVVMKPLAATQVFQEIGRLDLNDFLQYKIREIGPILTGLPESGGGVRLQAQAILAGKRYGDTFGVDVVFSNQNLLIADIVTAPDYLLFAGIPAPELRLYPIEMHIAEKLHAYTMPRTRENSRIKDLPDIALLAGIREISRDTFIEAVEQVFDSRKSHSLPKSLGSPPESWNLPYREMAMNDRLPWPDIGAVFLTVSSFLNPVLHDPNKFRRWDPESWTWK